MLVEDIAVVETSSHRPAHRQPGCDGHLLLKTLNQRQHSYPAQVTNQPFSRVATNPGNLENTEKSEFDSGQGKVREFERNQGKVGVNVFLPVVYNCVYCDRHYDKYKQSYRITASVADNAKQQFVDVCA